MTFNDGVSASANAPIVHDMTSRSEMPAATENHHTITPPLKKYTQEPIAVVGLSCRLPGRSNSPRALWSFLERGGCARNEPPPTRFNLAGHYDGSAKPRTMRSPGGMFLEDIDVRDIDAAFFGLSRGEALAMDPQIRQLLEVVYECLENSGITLQDLKGQPFGCFVGSYSGDFADTQARDPEDRAPAVTVGIGRAMLSNRISHFLNIKGPSMTIDTACSGSLVGLDVACRYLQTGEANGAIVAGCNLYLSPEHNTDFGAMKGAGTLTGKCHTFDVKADGYVKSEAVNCVILKRLSDAIRDGDPIRAIVRGSATNSDGWTAGIASPNPEAQAAATRQAYANAGIHDLSLTAYLECHGTGTQAGDYVETSGVSSVFAPSRKPGRPLIVGSIKSNIGHSEPAAGISGLLKTILTLENGIIPGNPTFITPNPRINFQALKIRASRTNTPWPETPFRRASLNSFGYGGSNVHVVVDEAKTLGENASLRHISSYASQSDDIFAEDEIAWRPYTIVLSANDEDSLANYTEALNKHLLDPATKVSLADLSYTLSERRSRHFQRAFIVTTTKTLNKHQFKLGKPSAEVPKIGLVFTGQGAQWPCMGKGLVEAFPSAKRLLQRLDKVLQSLPGSVSWSLVDELTQTRTPDHMRKPEFSQPLVTAIQLIILEVLQTWGVGFQSVVGHSSGEIAAACAAGYLTPEEAIKIAYYRGKAASDLKGDFEGSLGMLAAGISALDVQEYLKDTGGSVQIACFNSPQSVTLSGDTKQLEQVKAKLQLDGYFARLLQVDLAYHSKFMKKIGLHYNQLLIDNCQKPLPGNDHVTMYSSVTGSKMDLLADATYWTDNMISPVRFDSALKSMIGHQGGADFLIEVGPSAALAGPISQIRKSLEGFGSMLQYYPTLARSASAINSIEPLFEVAGQLFIASGTVNLAAVNRDDLEPELPRVIVDLPNYSWNHSTKHWYESTSSKDWRFRKFAVHDLLGSKMLGSPWHAPVFKKVLNVSELTWLQDHKMGHEIVFPAAGYIAMAIEALSQAKRATEVPMDGHRFRLRNVKFARALVLSENNNHAVLLSLTPRAGQKDSWCDFKIYSQTDDIWSEHCNGQITMDIDPNEVASASDLAPLQHATSAQIWYKAMTDAGYSFGKSFQKQLQVEATAGVRSSRAIIDMSIPLAEYDQSTYAMHPAVIDGCFQAGGISLWNGHRSSVNAVMIPAMFDELIMTMPKVPPVTGIAVGASDYVGRGRRDELKNYQSVVNVFDQAAGCLLMRLSGLRYHKLDTREDVHAGHSYTRLSWQPEVSSMTQDKLDALFLESDLSESSEVDQFLDMLSHNKPNQKVMELNMLPANSTSVWLDKSTDRTTRASCEKHMYMSADAAGLIEAQEKYASSSSEFNLLDINEEISSDSGSGYDLLVARVPLSRDLLKIIAKKAHAMLSNGGYLLLLEYLDTTTGLTNGTLEESTSSILEANGFIRKLNIPCVYSSLNQLAAASLFVAKPSEIQSRPISHGISLVHFSNSSKAKTIEEHLARQKWNISEKMLPFDEIPAGDIVLVLDEMEKAVLPYINEDQWNGLQKILSPQRKVMWVTAGSQMNVTKPENSLFHGFARSVRAEDPSLRLVTLDVASASGPDTIRAIDFVLEKFQQPTPTSQIESEFVERDGLIYTSRVVADNPLNQAEKESTLGAEPKMMSFHNSKGRFKMHTERLGMIDSLQYNEVATSEEPLLGDNFLEVDVHAAGLNFKDVAVAMGIVPDNQHILGLEGAGVVRRVGPAVSDQFHVGQRVGLHYRGCFANRIQATPDSIHPMPDDMTFEEASTISCVYLVSIMGLLHWANLSKGQTILIHSACGGVGLASIQLAQYKGAEIYATVGTEEKRQYLKTNFGIADDHIFSSRSTEFAPDLMKATKGRGVDVIINSLTGDILDESWRCIADCGTMIEIGKKDILDRNTLAMEPFNRNASFRALDMSHKSISDPMCKQLMSEAFQLVKDGHVKPISPIMTFPFTDIPSAFRFMRGGAHIGKLVISNGSDEDFEVPVRPAPKTFVPRGDASYMIVGGLKGLCGSLAIYLARCGAKHLVIMSRSGYADQKSQAVLKDIYALDCQVDLCQGDVAKEEDVKRAFKESTAPIRGVIQGAMVLRDKIFESMTVEDYHTAVSAKFQGTWNLHNAALEEQEPLDFFTLLSSISGVIGQKAQANYAAANVFLDAFAVYRQSIGLHCCSVDLGVIEDVGYIAEHSKLAARLDTQLWSGGINEALLHKILHFSIIQQMDPINASSSAQLITGIPVPQGADSQLLRDARFTGLCGGTTSGAKTESADFSKEIQAFFLLVKSKADASATLAAIIPIINARFTRILGLPEPMEPAKPLSSYGLDSLAAVEFRNWAKTELGAELTTLEITNAKSLSALCEVIVTKVETPA